MPPARPPPAPRSTAGEIRYEAQRRRRKGNHDLGTYRAGGRRGRWPRRDRASDAFDALPPRGQESGRHEPHTVAKGASKRQSVVGGSIRSGTAETRMAGEDSGVNIRSAGSRQFGVAMSRFQGLQILEALYAQREQAVASSPMRCGARRPRAVGAATSQATAARPATSRSRQQREAAAIRVPAGFPARPHVVRSTRCRAPREWWSGARFREQAVHPNATHATRLGGSRSCTMRGTAG